MSQGRANLDHISRLYPSSFLMRVPASVPLMCASRILFSVLCNLVCPAPIPEQFHVCSVFLVHAFLPFSHLIPTKPCLQVLPFPCLCFGSVLLLTCLLSRVISLSGDLSPSRLLPCLYLALVCFVFQVHCSQYCARLSRVPAVLVRISKLLGLKSIISICCLVHITY